MRIGVIALLLLTGCGVTESRFVDNMQKVVAVVNDHEARIRKLEQVPNETGNKKVQAEKK